MVPHLSPPWKRPALWSDYFLGLVVLMALLGINLEARQVTDLQVLGHGFWMRRLRVVESWICRVGGAFGL